MLWIDSSINLWQRGVENPYQKSSRQTTFAFLSAAHSLQKDAKFWQRLDKSD
jgi:hypothetical protein